MTTPSAERWRDLAPHLDRALELSGAARESFLAGLAGKDPQLVSDLRALLAREDEVARERFLETSAPLAGILPGASSSRTGQTLGAYTLETQLGEGGMGTIWLARRSDGTYESKVAIKLVRPGLDSERVLARFESERQVIARMNHPNIARVLDAGSAPDGRPFFVMEYVPGRALTDYCDDRRLSIRERLDLFVQVCEGVQHAHRNGVIHRDLKPTNILVAEPDGRPVPKIIDFGIAKAVGAAPGGGRDVTQEGLFLGTPAYMSPEQWESPGGPVDTRTDVYALGVLLHEILVGARPPSPSDRTKDAVATPPTARYAKLGSERDGIAARRGTDARALDRTLRGDLDWIVAKSIDADPERRYESPAALAQDLSHHLAGRPVAAGPPGFGYRAGKFVRRHRVGVGFAAAALAGLVAFAIVLAMQSARIVRERDRANREAATANRALQVLTDIFEVSDPSEARGSTVTAREILDRGAAKVDKEMGDEPLARAKLSHTVGIVYRNLGLYDSARPFLEKSVALRREHLGESNEETLESIESLATLLQETGKLAEAEVSFREVLAGRTSLLGPDHPDTLQAANNLGLILHLEGKLPEAEKHLRESVEGKRRLLGKDDPDLLPSLNNLGVLLQEEGKLEDAEPYLLEVLAGARKALGNDHPHTLTAISNMGLLLQAEGKLAEAEPYWREALTTRRRVLGNDHPQTLLSVFNMGYWLRAEGRLDEAEPFYREALDGYRRVLGTDHPRTLMAVAGMGSLLQAQGKLKEAERCYREALDGRRRALGDDHSDTIYSMGDVAAILAAEGKPAEAERLYRETIEHASRALGPANPVTLGSRAALADVYTTEGRLGEAEPLLRDVLATEREKLPPGHRVLGRTLRYYGRLLTALGRYPEAETALVEAQGILERSDPVTLPQLAASFEDLYTRWGKPAKAAEWRGKAGTLTGTAAK